MVDDPYMPTTADDNRTRAFVRGGVAAVVGLVAAALLSPLEHVTLVRILMSAISLLAIGEGAGLLTNWRGGTELLAEVVGGKQNDGTFLAVFGGKTWFIRGFFAPMLIIFGLIIFLGVAV